MTKPVIIVVDMLKDNINADSRHSMGEEGRKIIPNIQRALSSAREKGIPIIFANDSFLPGDFLFKSKMKPHCLRGTEGAEVIDDLNPNDGDLMLPKRRMSAFFKTDLDMTLRTLGVDTIAICGVSTQGCVFTTAFDGLANDFYTIILEDCCAAARKSDHETIINMLHSTPLEPLLKTMSLSEFMDSISQAD